MHMIHVLILLKVFIVKSRMWPVLKNSPCELKKIRVRIIICFWLIDPFIIIQ